MISTIKQTKNSILKKIIKTICVATFWILIWEAASRLVSRDNKLMLLIFPGPFTVLKKWFEIAFTSDFIKAEIYTLLRIFIGYFFGCIIGFLLGVLTHLSNITNALLSPVLKIIRTVPVVAIILIMYLFFDSSTMPVWIVSLMVTPLIWQTVHDGLNNTDTALIELAYVYNLSKYKTIMSVKLPYITPNIITSCVNSLGLAWKSGVAAEVICTTEISLGMLIAQGKSALNNDEVFAATLTVILLSIVIEYLLKYLCKKYLLKNGGIIND